MDIYYIYNKYISNANNYALIPNAQNKYLWALKNIGLNFISVQYFQRATWAFSWTLLEKFLFGSFPEMILRVSQILNSELLDNISYIYKNIYPTQTITGLTPKVQNKNLWVPKNISLIFISVQYFQRATWAFSWTLLEQFLFGSFPEMILRVSQILISNLNGI